MIYITGDTHGSLKDFGKINEFCCKTKTSINDIMIILGDSGLNYFCDNRDDKIKKYIEQIPISFYVIRGNHEERPELAPIAISDIGDKWKEDNYKNIYYLKDGVCTVGAYKCLVIGGAYSVDKHYRISMGYQWFKSEQMSDEEKQIITNLVKEDNIFDVVLTHSCPESVIPVEAFLPMVKQDTVDRGTELFLETIKNAIKYRGWYCGHWHIDKSIANENFRFLYDDIVLLG